MPGVTPRKSRVRRAKPPSIPDSGSPAPDPSLSFDLSQSFDPCQSFDHSKSPIADTGFIPYAGFGNPYTGPIPYTGSGTPYMVAAFLIRIKILIRVSALPMPIRILIRVRTPCAHKDRPYTCKDP